MKGKNTSPRHEISGKRHEIAGNGSLDYKKEEARIFADDLPKTLTSLGRSIVAHCERLPITMEELSHRSGITRRTLANLLQGKHKPKKDTVIRIAKGLQITFDELLSDGNSVSVDSERVGCNTSSSVICHLNKYTVPNDYWRNLSKQAGKRFILVGQTNKSWLFRNEEQRKQFASDIRRILANGGLVAIVASSENSIRENHLSFFRKYVYNLGSTDDQCACAGMIEELIYAETNDLHYQAVVSDDKMVVLPLMNSEQFREESIVIELNERTMPETFRQYMDDIFRLLEKKTLKELRRIL